MTIIELSQAEKGTATTIGQSRHTVNRKYGVTDTRRGGPQSNGQIDRDGALAEWAVGGVATRGSASVDGWVDG